MKIEKHILEEKDIQSRMPHWHPIFKIIYTHHHSEDFCLALRLYVSEGDVSISLQDENVHYVVTSADTNDLFSDFLGSTEPKIFLSNTNTTYKSISKISRYPFCYATKIIIRDKIAGLLIIYTNENESPEIKNSTEIESLLKFFRTEINSILNNTSNVEILKDIDFQKFIDNAQRSIIATNRYEQIQYINPQAAKLLNLNTTEVYDKRCTDLLKYYNKTTRKRSLDPIKITLQTAKPYTIPKDTIIIHSSGDEICIEGFTIPIFDKQNVLKGAFILMNDTTVQRAQQVKKQEHIARFECEKKLSNIGYVKFDYRKNKIDLDANSSQIILGSDKFTTLPITDFFTRIIDHTQNNELSNLVERIERFQTSVSEEIIAIRTLTNEEKIINYRFQNTFDAAGKLILQEGIVSYLNEETILRNATSIIGNAAHIYFLRYQYNTGKIEFHTQLCHLLDIEPCNIRSLDQILEYIDEYDKPRFVEWLESIILDKKNDGIIIDFVSTNNIHIPTHTQRYYTGLQNSDQNALFLVFQDLRHIYNNSDFIDDLQHNQLNGVQDPYKDNSPITHFLDTTYNLIDKLPLDGERIKLFLKQTAQFLKVENIVLFLHNDETQHLDFYKEWHNKINSHFDYKSLFFKMEEIPDTYSKLKEKQNIAIDHIDDIKDNHKVDWEFFQKRGTNSVLAIPVFSQNQLFAVILCESTQSIKPIRNSYLNQIALAFALLAKEIENAKSNHLVHSQLNNISSLIDAIPHSFCVFDQNATLEKIHLSPHLLTLAKENEIQIEIEHLNKLFVKHNISNKVAELIRQITNEQYTSIKTNIKVEVNNQDYIFDIECTRPVAGSFLCMFNLVSNGIVSPQKNKSQKLKKAFSIAGIGDWTYIPGQEEFVASYETATHLGFTQELKEGYKINLRIFTQHVLSANAATLTQDIAQLYNLDEVLTVNQKGKNRDIHLKAQWYETINNKLVLQGISQDVSRFKSTEENHSWLIDSMKSISDAVFILSDDLKIVYANDAAVNNYATDDTNILSQPIQSVLLYIDEATLAQIHSMSDNNKISLSAQIENKPHLKNEVHLHISKISTENQTSYIVMINTEKPIIQDIITSDSQKYQHLYAVFNAMPCPIIIVNDKKKIININTEARLLFADNLDHTGKSNIDKCMAENAILPQYPNIVYNESGILNYVKSNVSRAIPYRLSLLEEKNKQERDFIIMLDCAQKDKLKSVAINTTKKPETDKTYYILIVDDLMENYVLLKELLDIDRECKYYWAKNGQIAIDIVQTNPDIELILMDIDMPVMNGIEATKKIKAQAPHIPIIMQSAYSQANERNEAHEAGCDDFVPKPTDYLQLARKIKKILKIF